MIRYIGNIAYTEISEVALIGCFDSPYNLAIELEALMQMSPFLTVSRSCDQTLSWVNQQLLKVGLRTVQTFDLHTARAASHDCECPHHGTEKCDCQMIVLLVYGDSAEPATLTLHGNDGKTWISVADDPEHRATTSLTANIRRVMESGMDSNQFFC